MGPLSKQSIRDNAGLMAGASAGYKLGYLIERSLPLVTIPLLPRLTGLVVGAFVGAALQVAIRDVRRELEPVACGKIAKTRRPSC